MKECRYFYDSLFILLAMVMFATLLAATDLYIAAKISIKFNDDNSMKIIVLADSHYNLFVLKMLGLSEAAKTIAPINIHNWYNLHLPSMSVVSIFFESLGQH